MSDRELLELAAKVAGYGEVWTLDSDPDTFYIGPRYTGGAPKYRVWNPLVYDGDALRLAVKLGLQVDCSRPSAGEPFKRHAICLGESRDIETLTRRAIVRAAAEIGRNMT